MGHRSQVRYDRTNRTHYCRYQRRKYILGPDYGRACARFAEIIGTRPETGEPPITVTEAVRRYLGNNPGTFLEERLACWSRYAVEHPGVTLSKLSDETLRKYLRWQTAKGWAPKTIRHNMAALLRVLRWCYEQEWIRRVPKVPRLPAPAVGHRDYTTAQLDTLHRVLQAPTMKHARPIVLFMLATGCRPGEAIGLRWSDVDLERGLCELGKHKTAKATGRRRVIPLTPDARAILESLPRQRENVFLSRLRKPYTRSGLSLVIRRHGLPGIQRLRHTFAQHQLERGVPPHVLAAILGHSSLAMVTTYAQVRMPQVLATASALDTPARRILREPPPSLATKKKARARRAKKPASPRKSATARPVQRGKRAASRTG